MGGIFGTSKLNKAAYIELLCMMYQIFRLAKTKGLLALESTGEVMWVDAEAQIDAVTALSGSGPAYMFYFMEAMREAGIGMGLDAAQAYQLAVATFIGAGELAKASAEPPEVLGRMIGGALTGTFLGVWFAYGFIAPMASSIKARFETDGKYYQALKVGLIGHLHGYAPSVSVEYARKTLNSEVRPSFTEVEEATAQLPKPD
ncbi:MAG: hypothetical protein EBZ69_10495 [Alphaproteobacteria bacterium]|nr:hypothetical protein [Alphaproteobacteria bacterium]